jgi:dTDP-glucose 4,6-dehydratase
MKWLIYGHKGWIGGQLKDYLISGSSQKNEVVDGLARCDDPVALEIELKKIRPDVVFSCIGRTHGGKHQTIDYLEQEGKLVENLRDNLVAPLTLAAVCRELKVYYVYLGTGCIFEYTTTNKLDAFDEDAEANFFGSQYSITKGFTEKLFKTITQNHNALNLRIRMPVTNKPHFRNFITKITHYDKVINVPNSMTVLPFLWPYLHDLVTKKVSGTLNFVNPGAVSHNQILDMYQEIVDPEFRYRNFTEEEQDKILASRRSNNRLSTQKLENLCPGVPCAETAIRKCLQEYKKEMIQETVLVTGGCGFIASNMITHLYNKYPHMRILNIDSLAYSGDEENVPQRIRQDTFRYKLFNLNICDEEKLSCVFEKNKVNLILHFAAETHVDNSFDNALIFTKTNVLGTHTLLQQVKKYNIKFVHISTDEVYGGENNEKVVETHRLNPTNPYAASKVGAEALVNSYQYSFKLPCTIIRCNNVYGPCQFPEKLIPKFTLMGLQNVPMTIHGEGLTQRSFIHVSDVVEAVDTVMRKGKNHEVYNIGIDDEFTVKDVARKITQILELKQAQTVHVADRAFNDERYYINSDKLRSLGWSPQISFDDGLKKTVQWYRQRKDKWISKMNH